MDVDGATSSTAVEVTPRPIDGDIVGKHGLLRTALYQSTPAALAMRELGPQNRNAALRRTRHRARHVPDIRIDVDNYRKLTYFHEYPLGFSPTDLRCEGDAIFGGTKYRRMLLKHDGCVNGACWNEDGSLMATGSDDLKLKIWSFYARGTPLQNGEVELKPKAIIQTMHRNNIFHVGFVPEENSRLVSCGADGMLWHHHVDSACQSDEAARSSGRADLLYESSRMVFMCEFTPKEWVGGSRSVLYAACAEGRVVHCDVRTPSAEAKTVIKLQSRYGVKCVALYKGNGAPLMAVGTEIGPVLIYDARMLNGGPVYIPTDEESSTRSFYTADDADTHMHFGDTSPVNSTPSPFSTHEKLTPKHALAVLSYNGRRSMAAVSGIQFSARRPEVLVSYQNSDIYTYPLGDLVNNIPKKFTEEEEAEEEEEQQNSEEEDIDPARAGLAATLAAAVAARTAATAATGDTVVAAAAAGGDSTTVSTHGTGGSGAAAAAVISATTAATAATAAAVAHMVASASGDNASCSLGKNSNDDTAMSNDSDVKEQTKEEEEGQQQAVKEQEEQEEQEEQQQQQQQADNGDDNSDDNSNSEREEEDEEQQQQAGNSDDNSNLDDDDDDDDEDDDVMDSDDDLAEDSDVAHWREINELRSSRTIDLDSVLVKKVIKPAPGKFVGHGNEKTFLKNVCFFGAKENYVLSGSDDGCLYIWDRKSMRVVDVVQLDKHVVNGACPHPDPSIRAMLSWGIDSHAKLVYPGVPHSASLDPCVSFEDAVKHTQLSMPTSGNDDLDWLEQQLNSQWPFIWGTDGTNSNTGSSTCESCTLEHHAVMDMCNGDIANGNIGNGSMSCGNGHIASGYGNIGSGNVASVNGDISGCNGNISSGNDSVGSCNGDVVAGSARVSGVKERGDCKNISIDDVVPVHVADGKEADIQSCTMNILTEAGCENVNKRQSGEIDQSPAKKGRAGGSPRAEEERMKRNESVGKLASMEIIGKSIINGSEASDVKANSSTLPTPMVTTGESSLKSPVHIRGRGLPVIQYHRNTVFGVLPQHRLDDFLLNSELQMRLKADISSVLGHTSDCVAPTIEYFQEWREVKFEDSIVGMLRPDLKEKDQLLRRLLAENKRKKVVINLYFAMQAAEQFKEEGNSYFKRAQYAQAVCYYLAAMAWLPWMNGKPLRQTVGSRNPNEATAGKFTQTFRSINLNCATTMMKLGRCDLAQMIAKWVIRQAGPCPKSLFRSASANQALGLLSAAVKLITKAAKLDPNNTAIRRKWKQLKEQLRVREEPKRKRFTEAFGGS